jgi:hypothetical protein
MPTLTIPQLKQQVREAHQELRALARAVSLALAQLETVMQAPASPARERRIAAIANALDLANDKALHFGLGESLAAIKREKQRLRDLVEQELPALSSGTATMP